MTENEQTIVFWHSNNMSLYI